MKLKIVWCASMLSIFAMCHNSSKSQQESGVSVIQQLSFSEDAIVAVASESIIAWWFFVVYVQRAAYKEYFQRQSLINPKWADPFSDEFLTIASNLEN